VLEIVKQQQQAINELKSENQELKHTIEALRGE
jgi:hypothetical protein